MSRVIRAFTGRGVLGVVIALVGLGSVGVRAGGTPENALIVIDPLHRDSLYIANYYMEARQIPPVNTMYIDSIASNFAAFREVNIEALFGRIAHEGVADHVDYIVVAPASSFYVSAPNLVEDFCSPVRRFAVSSAYYLSFVADEILEGEIPVGYVNRYRGQDESIYGFDSEILWKNGHPSDDGNGRYLFLASALGYTGERGNTVDELIQMIDRSVAVDGTFPTGTFYFMETNDDARSDPRENQFDPVVDAIETLGGQAEHRFAVLPIGEHDCMGIMTGFASPGIEDADLTILDGAFCDHLTSFAARFDTSSQEKLSRWIARGASGSWGAVEEPCNYSDKFPHARMHLYYYKGLSLGEAATRSANWSPFQMLLYGDPLTRPFTHIPTVDVPDAPTGPVSGDVILTPDAVTTDPNGVIEHYELLVDGVLAGSAGFGGVFTLDTTALADGWHDVRVLAYDDTLVRSVGRWIGEFVTDNRGRSISLDADVVSGDWGTTFSFDLAAVGSEVDEVRLVQNGRVVAAAGGSAATLDVAGQVLGAGPARVQAEALFADGARVRSAPLQVDVDYAAGTPGGAAPTAYGYTRVLRRPDPVLVELPATWDDAALSPTWTLLTTPLQAEVIAEDGKPYRLLAPDPLADGADAFEFLVESTAGDSNMATVTLIYDFCVGDLTGDRSVDLEDLSILLSNFGTTDGATLGDGDIDGDGAVDLEDLSLLLGAFGGSCP